MNIAIIGDYNPLYPPHPATTQSLGHASSALGIDFKIIWIPTEKLNLNSASPFALYNAIWLGPAPYANKLLVIEAVKYIREHDIPFLGTCGGLYQSLTEFGTNALKLDVKLFENKSLEPGDDFFMMDTNCGVHGFKTVHFETIKGTKTFEFYNQINCEEESNCGFIVNPAYFKVLEENGMVIGGIDENNEAKAFELRANKFFILTKFLPQMRSDIHKPHPLITSFLKAAYQ